MLEYHLCLDQSYRLYLGLLKFPLADSSDYIGVFVGRCAVLSRLPRGMALIISLKKFDFPNSRVQAQPRASGGETNVSKKYLHKKLEG